MYKDVQRELMTKCVLEEESGSREILKECLTRGDQWARPPRRR